MSSLLRPRFAAALMAVQLLSMPAQAGPWAEVGDNQLRTDIELLAEAGALDGITTHWPLPWRSIGARLRDGLDGQPETVRAAAERVLRRARAETEPGFSASLYLDATHAPSVVYGFDGMGRGQGTAQAVLDFNQGIFSGRLALGGITQNWRGNTTRLNLDESYLSARLGDVRLYGGWLSHWWGPGQVTALSLSNNARPMPQIGISRAVTDASSLPVLRWLGPWQAEFLLGVLDGPRLQRDTYYNALRVTFNPLPGLEIGLSRTQMFCGQGVSCAPLRDYFAFRNDNSIVNRTNDQGAFDIKYSGRMGELPFQIYMQAMNEDSSPITYSVTSHLFGAGIFLPVGDNPLKLTLEYADSVPTVDIFSFGTVLHGAAYNNSRYPDGMRYRGRSLGFSLDSDSTLLSLMGSWTDPGGRFWQLSLHKAAISNPLNVSGNAVTAAPVHVTLGEARVSLPLVSTGRSVRLDLAGRLQDDQPRPHRGLAAGIEAALRFDL
ncbi:MAG: hypothetical protein BGN82_01515 [Alphaproteobacteria bacterium 65-7]|mgnify:FL=1|nr:MAG: hypothetical protein BGN82_01515 [Alphaproteobacteria bacterium 65-7]